MPLRKLKFAVLLAASCLALRGPAAVAPFFKVGVGDQVKVNFSPYNTLASYMSADSVRNHFQTHWFHAGWKTHFPVAIAGGACAGGGEWSSLADYQGVLNAGRILVIIWWWHNDMPCDASIRADAQTTAANCLVPLLQSLNNGEVWVVFEPEYNLSAFAGAGTGGACGSNRIHRDPSWGTHVNSMILAAKGAAHAGLTVRAGAAIGGFGYDENVYNVEGSLQNCYANSDFIAYHHITRSDIYGEDAWACPSPEASKFSLSLSRYLRRRFNKPLFYAYWTSRNGLPAGQAGQNADLLDHFANRAEFEADGVQGFGPYWYHDNGYPGEGIRQNAGTAYTAFNTWRTESNAVFDGTNGIHSLAFSAPDHGDIFESSSALNLQWLSRGRPASGCTYSTYYRVNGGPDQAFANPYSAGGPYGDGIAFSATLDLCTIAPSANVQVKAVASDATFAYSRRFTVRNPNYTSNAQHNFDSGGQLHGWSAANAWFSGQKFSSVSQSTANYFHGGGAMELGGTFGNTGPTQKNAIGNNNSVVLGGSDPRSINLKVYIPFDLNPSVDMGAAVSYLNYQVRLNSTIYDNYALPTGIPLEMGWNDVTITITAGTGGTIDHVDLVFYNEWGQAGNAFFGVAADPKIYVDEIHYGGPAVFSPSGGGCASPTPSATAAGTGTATRTGTASPTRSPSFSASPTPLAGTPTATPTRSATPSSASATPSPSPSATRTASTTPSPVAACTADYNFEPDTQGWTYDGASDTGFTAVSWGTTAYSGTRSLQITAALTVAGAAMAGAVYRGGAGFPMDLSGRTISTHFYAPAGFSSPHYAQVFVKTGAGFTYIAGPSTVLSVPGWTSISFDLGSVPTANDVRQIGLKVGLSGGAPAFNGTVYMDDFDLGISVCASPTPSSTLSPSRTASPSPSATATRTATPSQSPSPDISPSSTRSPTLSATASSSASPTRSPSPTASPTPSRTGTLSASPSPTPPLTSTASLSITVSFTPALGSATASPTLSPSSTAPPSPTGTGSITPSFTPSRTSTPAPSATASPSVTPLISSATPSRTAMASPTLSFSATPAPPSATPSQSPSPTASLTVTTSASRTASATPSSSPVDTLTPTPSPSGSETPLAAATATRSPQAGPPVIEGPGQVVETKPSLNPQGGARLLVSVRIDGKAEGFELTVVSKAMVIVAKAELAGSYFSGWHSLAFAVPELANGIWYYEIRSLNSGQKGAAPRVGKVMILK